MANFGLQRLSVVAPFEPNWREARSAIGAPKLLVNAVESATLAEAVAAATLVVGTGTLTRRKPEQPVVPLPELARWWGRLAPAATWPCSSVQKNMGLPADDLAYLPSPGPKSPPDPRQPSMKSWARPWPSACTKAGFAGVSVQGSRA